MREPWDATIVKERDAISVIAGMAEVNYVLTAMIGDRVLPVDGVPTACAEHKAIDARITIC